MTQPSAVGERYLRRTFEGMWELFAEGQGPLGTNGASRRYAEFGRVALPPAIGRPRQSGGDRPPGTVPSWLPEFLWLGFGLHSLEVGPSSGWPYHRTTPSARCLYPTEVYVWLAAGDGLPSGLYHYDAPHHGLDLLRSAVASEVVGRAVGRDLAGVTAAAFVTSVFHRTAARYRNYAYRLCSQEAGMTVGCLAFAAEACGFRPAVCYRFLDQAVQQLLGLPDGIESPFAVLTLTESEGPVVPPELTGSVSVSAATANLSPLTVPTEESTTATPQFCPEALELDSSSRLVRLDSIRPCVGDATGCPPSAIAPLDPVADGTSEFDCGISTFDPGALIGRESGPPNFQPIPVSMTFAQLCGIVRRATTGEPPGDLRLPSVRAPLSIFVVANRVTDLSAGVYRFAPGGPRVVHNAPVGRRLQRITRSTNINACASPAVLYVCTDAKLYLDGFGDRGYRIMNLEAGALAQRLSIAAAAHALAARVSNGYDTPALRELLGLGSSWDFPVFQIFLAKLRLAPRYRFPLGGCT
ncbi:SagB family peptide dehydrogenase [Nocardia sp. NPDC051052]|uniref:SagB family peptide dehydrogenase n=1 Tax=Nocardia sp. NPDC051052 TaxID=3364322 RepID=UPI0037A7AF3E